MCTSFSCEATVSGEIPVKKPNSMYDGKKAKALKRSGKWSVCRSTIAGITHNSVPNNALILVVEDKMVDVVNSDSMKYVNATIPY